MSLRIARLFTAAEDRGKWELVWRDNVETLIDGTTSGGYLMMRNVDGICRYRELTNAEVLAAERAGEGV